MSTPIFTPEDLKLYAETRLFGNNVRPADVSSIRLYNGTLPSELIYMITSIRGDDYVKVEQKNGREPLFFHDGVLFIPQYMPEGAN